MTHDISLSALAAMPGGTRFDHVYFEFDDESEDDCVLISAVEDGEFWHVRYANSDGVEKSMWINDEDSGILLAEERAQ